MLHADSTAETKMFSQTTVKNGELWKSALWAQIIPIDSEVLMPLLTAQGR
jgi:hypothetical protein